MVFSGIKIAVLNWDKFKVVNCKDRSGKYFKTLALTLKRIKTQNVNPDSDDIIHFCHKDDILQDYFFLLFYYLVMKNEGVKQGEKIFPNWAKHVNLSATSGTESKVSSKFREFWGIMYKLCEKYMREGVCKEDINDDMIVKYCIDELQAEGTSHGGKKRGVQDMADSHLSPQVRFVNVFRNR